MLEARIVYSFQGISALCRRSSDRWRAFHDHIQGEQSLWPRHRCMFYLYGVMYQPTSLPSLSGFNPLDLWWLRELDLLKFNNHSRGETVMATPCISWHSFCPRISCHRCWNL